MPNKGKLLDRKANTTIYTNNSTSHHLDRIDRQSSSVGFRFVSVCMCGWESFPRSNEYDALDVVQLHVESMWHSDKQHLFTPYKSWDGLHNIACTCGWHNIRYDTAREALDSWNRHLRVSVSL